MLTPKPLSLHLHVRETIFQYQTHLPSTVHVANQRSSPPESVAYFH